MLALTLRFKAKGQPLLERLTPESEPADQLDQLAHQDYVDVPVQHKGIGDEKRDDQSGEPKGNGVGHS